MTDFDVTRDAADTYTLLVNGREVGHGLTWAEVVAEIQRQEQINER